MQSLQVCALGTPASTPQRDPQSTEPSGTSTLQREQWRVPSHHAMT